MDVICQFGVKKSQNTRQSSGCHTDKKTDKLSDAQRAATSMQNNLMFCSLLTVILANVRKLIRPFFLINVSDISLESYSSAPGVVVRKMRCAQSYTQQQSTSSI